MVEVEKVSKEAEDDLLQVSLASTWQGSLEHQGFGSKMIIYELNGSLRTS